MNGLKRTYSVVISADPLDEIDLETLLNRYKELQFKQGELRQKRRELAKQVNRKVAVLNLTRQIQHRIPSAIKEETEFEILREDNNESELKKEEDSDTEVESMLDTIPTIRKRGRPKKKSTARKKQRVKKS